jgi:hypothetical protein
MITTFGKLGEERAGLNFDGKHYDEKEMLRKIDIRPGSFEISLPLY